MSSDMMHGGTAPGGAPGYARDNPLRLLEALGQSVWLDQIRRDWLESGEFKRLIDEDGLSGVTSNPTIYEKAVSGSEAYNTQVRELAQQGKDAPEIYEAIVVRDLQQAADLLRRTYERTGGDDGFVSMEVSPHLAHDTEGTIQEARRFWQELDRPNVMIKVPGTREGLSAIRQLTGEGINVNVTLLFGLPRYKEVIGAYMGGLEDRADAGMPLDHLRSVASFFLSRIDTLVDPTLEKMAQGGTERGRLAQSLVGELAIAQAKVAYQIWQKRFAEERFHALAEKGARRQKLLWASTSTKNPAYHDLKYVEALIGPETINTMPLETLHAFRDHGNPQPLLEGDVLASRQALQRVAELGIDMDQVTQQLEDEGIEKFATSFNQLMETIKERMRLVRGAAT